MASRRKKGRIGTAGTLLSRVIKCTFSSLSSLTSRPWFLWSAWIVIVIPSIIGLYVYWLTPVRTFGEAFIAQVIAIVLATFIAWMIWDRTRIIRAREEDQAARKARQYLFLQASGLIYDICGQIFDKLIGDYPPFGMAYDADINAVPPTLRNRILTYAPDEVFRRGRELKYEATHLWERANDLRLLAYSLAVQLRLREFLNDWDQFISHWNYLLGELEHPLKSDTKEGVERIASSAQQVFLKFRDLSEKLESDNYH